MCPLSPLLSLCPLDVVLRSVEEASERTLEAYDPLSVTLLFKTSGKTPQGDTPFYRAPLVRP